MTDPATAPTIQLTLPRLSAGARFAHRYEILSVLGHGGMGDVYRVRDHELAEDVALKVLKPELAEVEGALERFRREVKLARRVTHPNVARTYDLGSFEGTRFLTMELIVGDALGKHVGKGKRPPLADSLRILAEVARGLAAAHAVGVVHRDLKPDNVMIDSMGVSHVERAPLDGRVVITDFGIARLAEGALLDQATRHRTHVGQTLGTPAYMAPEQLEGQELDGRADIYALGVLFFEMLTGELPFVGDSVYAVAAARLSGNPPDPRTRDATIPEGVARLALDAMARKREARPDAQGLLERVDAIRGVVLNVGVVGARAPVSRADSQLGVAATIEIASLPTQSVGPRTVAVAPFTAQDAATESFARDLTLALADASSKVRGVRVLSPGSVRKSMDEHVHQGALDASALGRAVNADVVVDGSLRVASGKARVRVRMVDVGKSTQLWAERFEGPLDDPFALEDALITAVSDALRARFTDTEGRRVPSDPIARELYERARVAYHKFGLPFVRQAIEILEDGHARFPDDAFIMSLLGAAITRVWQLTGGSDRAMLARAEEVSLRALAADSTIGETYNTIGLLRGSQGELRASVRAYQDALARSPLIAEAHLSLGRLLTETGHVEEGMRRFDVAIRLDPSSVWSYLDRARVYALLGDRKRAEAEFAKASTIGGPFAVVLILMRCAVWWNDKELLLAAAKTIEDAKTGGAFEAAPPLLRAYAAGVHLPQTQAIFDRLEASARAAPRHRVMMFQIACEHWAGMGSREEALVALERAAELPLVDLLWLDRCPTLDVLRADPRFALVRAIVAARAAELWT